MVNVRRACLGFVVLFISACGATPTPNVILPTLAEVATPTFSVLTAVSNPPPCTRHCSTSNYVTSGGDRAKR